MCFGSPTIPNVRSVIVEWLLPLQLFVAIHKYFTHAHTFMQTSQCLMNMLICVCVFVFVCACESKRMHVIQIHKIVRWKRIPMRFYFCTVVFRK